MPVKREAAQADALAGRILPIATTMLSSLVSVQPLHLPGYMTLMPLFTLMTVYHWTIYRPDLLPPLALFGIGLADDLLSGEPPGVASLLYLLSRSAVLRCRRRFIDQSFLFIWGGFILLTGIAILGLWALHSALAFRVIGFRGSVFRYALTISLYPICSFLLGRSQRAFLGTG
jgi:rod shape-determining protein MreD